MTIAATVPVQESESGSFRRVVIIAQGILTVWLALAILPLGVVAMLVNAVLAFASRGTDRRLFAGFALAAAVIMAFMVLFLMPASVAQVTESVPAH